METISLQSLPAAGLRGLLHLRARDLADAQCHRRSAMHERSRNFRPRTGAHATRSVNKGGRACRLARVAEREMDQAAELLAEVR